MTKAPAFQFYPGDWLSSLQTAVMTPAQEGAYIRLLCYCWGSGDCSLPDDDDQLAVMSRLGEGWFNGGSTVLRRCFLPHPAKPGFLTNDRLLQEATKQAEWSLKSARGGRKSAEKRAASKGGSRVVEPPRPPKGNSSSSPSSYSEDESSSYSTTPPTPEQEARDAQAAGTAGSVLQWIKGRLNAPFPYQVGPVAAWLANGADVELDIKSVIDCHVESGQPPPRNSLAFFDRHIAESIRQRTKKLAMEETDGYDRHRPARPNGRGAMRHTGLAHVDHRAAAADSGFVTD